MKTAFDKLSESQQQLGEADLLERRQTPDAGRAGRRRTRLPRTSSDEDIVDAEVVDDEEDKK